MTVRRSFVNELGNHIKITIEGPSSISENTLTELEATHLRDALNQTLERRHLIADTAALDALPADVVKLVIAARRAVEDSSNPHTNELDQAAEAFADRVPWEDEPEANQCDDWPSCACGRGGPDCCAALSPAEGKEQSR